MASDPNDAAIIDAIIVMAHKLGLKVVAEGIETEMSALVGRRLATLMKGSRILAGRQAVQRRRLLPKMPIRPMMINKSRCSRASRCNSNWPAEKITLAPANLMG
jgi:hypothetical protein